jgi:hypothetical protein
MHPELSLVVCLVGLIIFAVLNPPPPAPTAPVSRYRSTGAEIGKIMFWCGLLVFLFHHVGDRIF